MNDDTNKILLIEDDDYMRIIITEILTSNGYEVLEADDGKSGIARAMESIPDLIISDLMLPDIDGYAILNKVKESNKLANVPFIFLTSETEKDMMRKGMNLGADDFLHKPIQFEELLSAVKIRLEKSSKIKAHNEERIDEFRQGIGLAIPHELNTPLNVILGFSEIIKSDFDTLSREELIDMVDCINDGASRLKNTIDRMLLFTHIEMTAINPKRLDELSKTTTLFPNSEISNIIYSLEEHKNRLDDIELLIENRDLKINPDYFRIILKEIIDNSLKFSETSNKVSINGEIKNGNYVISIVDNGMGMSEEQISKIGAFVQFNRKIYEKQGTGLGLAIVNKLLSLFDCSLNIESKLKVGTKITINFPLTNTNQNSLLSASEKEQYTY